MVLHRLTRDSILCRLLSSSHRCFHPWRLRYRQRRSTLPVRRQWLHRLSGTSATLHIATLLQRLSGCLLKWRFLLNRVLPTLGGTINLATIAPDHQANGHVPATIVATCFAAGGHPNATLAAQPMALYQQDPAAYAQLDNYMAHMMGFQPQVVANQPIQEQSTVQQKMPVP